MEAMEHERHQNAAERPCHEIADHGKADHQTEIGHLEPRRRCNAGNDREGQTVDQPYKYFAQDDARRIRARQLVRRERTDRHRHGLGGSIAPLARHDRRQYRQGHHFLQFPLEQAKHR